LNKIRLVFFLLDLKDKREQSGYCFAILIVLSYVLVVFTFPLSLCFCLKVSILFINIRFILLFDNKKKQVVQEYERAVIFRLGRILANGARGK
jgi:erythrocyte band 7 integral membrane protein